VHSFYIQTTEGALRTKLTVMNFEFLTEIKWWAVLVAAIAYFMLGAIWYSKALFGTKWAQLVNLDVKNPDLKKGMGKMMISTLVLILIVCIGLALVIRMINFDYNYMYGIKLGLLTGITFATTAISIGYVYENKPTNLYLISSGYHIVGHVIAATILVLWR
jgi:hypothetical protein